MNFQMLENQLNEAAAMDILEPIQFIAGTFQPDEARDILMTLINDKINFHKKRIFSAMERFGAEDELSKQRLPKLIQIRETMSNIIKEAAQQNKILTVHSTIHITLEDNPSVAEEMESESDVTIGE